MAIGEGKKGGVWCFDPVFIELVGERRIEWRPRKSSKESSQARAKRWKRELEIVPNLNRAAIARREGCSRAYVTQVLRRVKVFTGDHSDLTER